MLLLLQHLRMISIMAFLHAKHSQVELTLIRSRYHDRTLPLIDVICFVRMPVAGVVMFVVDVDLM